MKAVPVGECDRCPYKDHKGGFGQIAYKPVCRKAGRDIPFTEHASNGRVVARAVVEIPAWCPLPDFPEENNDEN